MAKAAPVARGSVVNLFRRGAAAEADEEVVIGPVAAGGAARAARTLGNLADLTGKTPMVFEVGAGKTGKSTFARWYGADAAERGEGVLLASVDAGNRTLPRFFDGVHQPTEGEEGQEVPSRNPTVMARWFRDLLDWELGNPTPALIDFGANDTVLQRQLQQTPGLAAALEEKGIAPVLMAFFGPRIDDLDPLVALEATGFQPAATALVLNYGMVDTAEDPTEAFAAIRRHSKFRAAIERGAVVIEMPRLDPELAKAIETKVLHFAQARDGTVPEGRKVTPIGGLDRAAVGAWMERMKATFGPLIEKGWLK